MSERKSTAYKSKSSVLDTLGSWLGKVAISYPQMKTKWTQTLNILLAHKAPKEKMTTNMKGA